MRPIGYRILIEKVPAPEKPQSGLLYIPTQLRVEYVYGRVLAMGEKVTSIPDICTIVFPSKALEEVDGYCFVFEDDVIATL